METPPQTMRRRASRRDSYMSLLCGTLEAIILAGRGVSPRAPGRYCRRALKLPVPQKTMLLLHYSQKSSMKVICLLGRAPFKTRVPLDMSLLISHTHVQGALDHTFVCNSAEGQVHHGEPSAKRIEKAMVSAASTFTEAGLIPGGATVQRSWPPSAALPPQAVVPPPSALSGIRLLLTEAVD